jgi:DNA-binding transcriptional regulator YhcF (GntR family)
MNESPRIEIDPASSTPVVRQILDNVRLLLVEGKLAPGSPLPSVRRLAMELGVHFNTVAESYRQLAAEGWLELKHGRNAVVVRRSVTRVANRDWADGFRTRVRVLVAQIRSEGVTAKALAQELQIIAAEVTKS